MRVICIDGVKAGSQPYFAGELNSGALRNEEEIFEGRTYEVIQIVEFDDEDWYKLEGQPQDTNYHSKRFIQCSDKEEEKSEAHYFDGKRHA